MNSADQTADLLDELWRRSAKIDNLSADVTPHSVEDARAVQASYLRRHTSSGWKVGMGPDGVRWAAAPLRGDVISSPARLSGVLPDIEIEVAFTLGSALPARSSVDQAELAVSACSMALELFQSRYTRPDEMPFPLILADNLNNAGVILGSGLSAQNLPSLAELKITLEADGIVVATSQGGPSFNDLLVPLCWLADYASELGQPLNAGDTVITGARIGALPIEGGKTYRVNSLLGSVEFVTD